MSSMQSMRCKDGVLLKVYFSVSSELIIYLVGSMQDILIAHIEAGTFVFPTQPLSMCYDLTDRFTFCQVCLKTMTFPYVH